MFGNKKKQNRKDENQNYEYKFRRNGTIIQKPTDKDYDYAKIKRNTLLDNLEGADDYSDFTTKDKHNDLIYKFNDNNNISNFKYSDNTKKETRGVRRAEKGKSRKGTAFTINDDKVADELYKAIAGNSDVEYGRLMYNDLGDSVYDRSKIKYDIWTERNSGSISGNEVVDKFQTNNIIDFTHSHPFRYNYDNEGNFNHSMQIPSPKDIDLYNKITYHVYKHNSLAKNTSNIPIRSIPTTHIYHPWTNDPSQMPYTNEFNESTNIHDQIISNYTKNIKEITKKYK